METSTDPKTGKIELPEYLNGLQDLLDGILNQYQDKKTTLYERQWLRTNFAHAAEKYNRLADRRVYLININSVIAAMKYAEKKNDILG